MSCPEESNLMEYMLGRIWDRRVRVHLARCVRCQKRMLRLERGLEEESHSIQAQAAGFRLSGHPHASTMRL